LFEATQTVINNIYQPCYHQTIPGSLPRFMQSSFGNSYPKSSVGDTKTCEDLLGITNFLNQPTLHLHLHVDPVKFSICSDDVASKYKMNSNASEWLYPILIR
jgi:hypothetical protein